MNRQWHWPENRMFRHHHHILGQQKGLGYLKNLCHSHLAKPTLLSWWYRTFTLFKWFVFPEPKRHVDSALYDKLQRVKEEQARVLCHWRSVSILDLNLIIISWIRNFVSLQLRREHFFVPFNGSKNLLWVSQLQLGNYLYPLYRRSL